MEIIKIIINVIISMFFLVIFILLEKHFFIFLCLKNKRNYIFIIHWLDYTLILFTIFIISLFKNFDYFDPEEKSNIIFIKDQIFLYYPLIFANQFILNIFYSMQLLFAINNSKKKTNSNEVNCIYNFPYYFIKQISIIIIEVAFFFYIKNKFDDIKISYFISAFQISLMIICAIMYFVISKKYKNFLDYIKGFDSHNNIEQKKFDYNKDKILMISQHYFYKNICDILLNFPCIIFHTQTKFINEIKVIFGEDKTEEKYSSNLISYMDLYYYSTICFGILYLYLFGIMLLNIDFNMIGYIEKIFDILFCVKNYNFYLGNGKNIKNNQKLYNKKNQIDKINFNSYFKDDSDIDIKISNINETISESSSDLESSEESSEEDEKIDKNKNKDKDNNKKDSLKFEYSECNFFIIYKLLYLYFKTNKNIYLELDKKEGRRISKIDNLISSINNKNENMNPRNSTISTDEEIRNKFNMTYNSLNPKKNIGIASNVNVRDNSFAYNIKEKIDNISKITLYNKKKLISSKKFSLDEITDNIEDKKMKKFFKKHIYNNLNKNIDDNSIMSNTISTIKEKDESLLNSYSEFSNLKKNKLNKNNININDDETKFSIKSLTDEDLFDLNPYLNLNIKDIIKSLNISDNMDLFPKFSQAKLKNESYNNYYTKDLLLSLEIYDEQFFNSKQLKSFIVDYKAYLMDKIENFSYSFLPLFIGIFNIRYLSYNKIIVLYRNQITFSYNINFQSWVKLIINDTNKVIETSKNEGDIINVNEEEISNNLILDNNEYSNSVEILENDLLFLKNSIKYNMNFKINIFVLNDEHKNDLNNIGQSMISLTNNNTTNNNVNQVLDNIMRESIISFPCNDYSYRKFNFSKKYFGSDDVCLLEKLYINELVNNRYIFKIYFSDIFRYKTSCLEINKQNNKIKNKNKGNFNEKINLTTSINNDDDENEDDEENEIVKNNNNYCESLKSILIRCFKRANTETLDELN